MKYHKLLVSLFLILFIVPALLFAATGDNVKSARKVVTLLSNEKYEEVTSMFDSTMKKDAPPARLRALWTSLLGETGKFQKQLGSTTTYYGGYEIIVVTCKFEKSEMDVKVVFNKDGKVAGLFLSKHHGGTNQSEAGSGSTSGGPNSPATHESFISKDVSFENPEADVTLAGTLTLPDSTGTFPAVLLIAGSGPNGRNEAVAGHKIFKVLADYLTSHGIAVLRYDKRGIGESTGNYPSATTMDFASDALAGVNYLKTLKRVKHNEIGLVGHSEGGLIAPIVAAESHDVAFIVLMGAPGVSGYKIILRQLALIDKASGVSKGAVDSALTIERKLLDVVRTEKDSASAAAKLKSILENENHEPARAARVSVDELLSPWYRDFISYDPRPALEKVRCPVLAVWGSKDLQVPPEENLPEMRKALKKGGNKHFKVMELKGLNHLFQKAKTGSPLEYGMIKEAIAPKALDTIAKWILKETGNKK